MGICLSLEQPSPPQKNVKVVHFNGDVEEFKPPVTAAQVGGGDSLGKNYFLCTATQLLCPNSKPLKPDTFLDPGRIYFIVPYTALQSDVDSVLLVKKLTKRAKSRRRPGESPGSSFSSGSFGSDRVSAQRLADGSTYTHRRADPDVGLSPVSRSWRPKLDSIKEKSFNRRESDLQDL